MFSGGTFCARAGAAADLSTLFLTLGARAGGGRGGGSRLNSFNGWISWGSGPTSPTSTSIATIRTVTPSVSNIDAARPIFEFAKKMGLYCICTESVGSIDTIEKLVDYVTA